MAPIRRHIQERPEHKGAHMSKRMGQDQGPWTCSDELRLLPAPVPNQTTVIDNIDIEFARSPRPTATSACFPLDRLQHSEQRLRRKARVDKRHGINVSRLARASDRFGFVELCHGPYFNISAFDFA